MKEADNFIRSVYLLIMTDTLLESPALHVTTLHFTKLFDISLFLFKL